MPLPNSHQNHANLATCSARKSVVVMLKSHLQIKARAIARIRPAKQRHLIAGRVLVERLPIRQQKTLVVPIHALYLATQPTHLHTCWHSLPFPFVAAIVSAKTDKQKLFPMPMDLNRNSHQKFHAGLKV